MLSKDRFSIWILNCDSISDHTHNPLKLRGKKEWQNKKKQQIQSDYYCDYYIANVVGFSRIVVLLVNLNKKRRWLMTIDIVKHASMAKLSFSAKFVSSFKLVDGITNNSNNKKKKKHLHCRWFSIWRLLSRSRNNAINAVSFKHLIRSFFLVSSSLAFILTALEVVRFHTRAVASHVCVDSVMCPDDATLSSWLEWNRHYLNFESMKADGKPCTRAKKNRFIFICWWS